MTRRPGGWRTRLHRRLRRTAAVLTALGILAGLAGGGLLLVMPSVGNAPAVARAFDRTHHAVYPGPAVPARFAVALTATEDHRFYSEPGLDPFAVGRLAWGQATGQPDQGGATLYQQLAKMLYLSGHRGLWAQAEEVGLGVKLYLAYPRQRILLMYADVAYFGHNYYGLAAASCGYFGVAPAQLTWSQAAMLAGLVQAPSAYDPMAHYQLARSRQAHVFDRLVAVGALTRAQANRAYQHQLHLIGGPAAGCRG